jgi:hypothetical protein
VFHNYSQNTTKTFLRRGLKGEDDEYEEYLREQYFEELKRESNKEGFENHLSRVGKLLC